jgi:hypothetical protein
MKPVPDYNNTHCLDTWIGDHGECRYDFNISYRTDSVYLYEYYVEDNEPSPILEFTSFGHVYNVRDQKTPKLIGRLHTPRGCKFGSTLEFVSSTQSVNEQPAMRVLYEKPHVEMFINFEKALCKLLTMRRHYSSNRLIIGFLNADWGALKAANLSHPELTIAFINRRPLWD